MASLLIVGLLLGYPVNSLLLGASLISNIAQSIVSLDERNNPRPILIMALACMATVFMAGLALGQDVNQVALAASLLGNVAQAIIKMEQKEG